MVLNIFFFLFTGATLSLLLWTGFELFFVSNEDPLSDREREVLRLLAFGHTNQEIAKELYISVRTAESHRAHIMQKLRLSSRAGLVRYALAHGLLEDS